MTLARKFNQWALCNGKHDQQRRVLHCLYAAGRGSVQHSVIWSWSRSYSTRLQARVRASSVVSRWQMC